ncbi:MAG: hypothetical protein PW792_09665 [Acidobacteriaceae bacterium]|nr:hypothetical protein [Acidobacteriaceae bacterium]
MTDTLDTPHEEHTDIFRRHTTAIFLGFMYTTLLITGIYMLILGAIWYIAR